MNIDEKVRKDKKLIEKIIFSNEIKMLTLHAKKSSMATFFACLTQAPIFLSWIFSLLRPQTVTLASFLYERF